MGADGVSGLLYQENRELTPTTLGTELRNRFLLRAPRRDSLGIILISACVTFDQRANHAMSDF